jgi:hypothetical protein
MDFVESIQSEGVTFDRVPMGGGTQRHDSIVVEVDTENEGKNIEAGKILYDSFKTAINALTIQEDSASQ